MAVAVREGIDYRILDDDYRANFRNSYKPYKVLADGTQLYKCLYCGEVIALGKSYKGQEPLEVDHIIPKTRMGAGILWNPNKSWNLGPSCKSCNTSKSNYIDMRTIKGFNNKLKQKYLFGIGQNHGEVSGNTSKVLTVFLTVLIAVITILSPIAIVASWVFQGIWALVRRIFSLILKIMRRQAKKAVHRGKRFVTSIICKVFAILVCVYCIFFIICFLKTGSVNLLLPLMSTAEFVTKVFKRGVDKVCLLCDIVKTLRV